MKSPVRGRMGKKVDVYKHAKLGAEVPIYLDTHNMQFSALFGEATFRSQSLKEIRLLIEGAVEKSLDLKWIPILELEVKDPRGYFDTRDGRDGITARFEFSATRYYLARRTDGEWMQSEYCNGPESVTLTDHARSASNVFTGVESFPYTQQPVYRYHEDPKEIERFGTHYLPYSEDVWRVLLELRSRTDLLRTKVAELFTHGEELALLAVHIPMPTLPEKSEVPTPKRKKKHGDQ